MVQKAVVVKTEDGRLMARVERSEMCASCKACRFGQSEVHLVELPKGGKYQPDEEIDLSMPDGRVGLGSLIAYGIPLVALLAGLGAAWALALPEIIQAVIAVACAALGFLVSRALDKFLSKKGVFDVRACPRQ